MGGPDPPPCDISQNYISKAFDQHQSNPQCNGPPMQLYAIEDGKPLCTPDDGSGDVPFEVERCGIMKLDVWWLSWAAQSWTFPFGVKRLGLTTIFGAHQNLSHQNQSAARLPITAALTLSTQSQDAPISPIFSSSSK